MFTFNAGDWEIIDVKKWTDASFQLSVNNVYKGIKEGEALSEEYVKINQRIIQR